MDWKAKAEAGTPAPILTHIEPAKRYQSIETEVAIPALQSLIVSLAWGTLAGVGAGVLAYYTVLAWWIIPMAIAVIALVIFALQTTRLMAERRELLWKQEIVEHRDINGDGQIGPPAETAPAQPPRFVYVRDLRREQRLRDAAEFRFFLHEAYNGRGTTWRDWDGVALPSGRKVTRPIWDDYTGRLLSAGLGVREYPTSPITLVGSYRDALIAFHESF
jgi:hypothetical protein